MPGTILVVAGGSQPAPLVLQALPSIDFCVAADGGADSALALGLSVDAVVGDMDSIDVDSLAALRAAGADIREHPTRKDLTDLELAMGRAAEEDPERIVVIGIGGGRLDHALANVAVLAGHDCGDASVEGLVGSARLTVIRRSRNLSGTVGEIVSLLPLLGRAEGVTTEGLEYPLTSEPLEPGSGRGVSNRFVNTTATVTVGNGVLLSVQPFALADGVDG